MGQPLLVLSLLSYLIAAGIMMMFAYNLVKEEVEPYWLKIVFIIVIGIFWWAFLFAGIRKSRDSDG